MLVPCLFSSTCGQGTLYSPRTHSVNLSESSCTSPAKDAHPLKISLKCLSVFVVVVVVVFVVVVVAQLRFAHLRSGSGELARSTSGVHRSAAGASIPGPGRCYRRLNAGGPKVRIHLDDDTVCSRFACRRWKGCWRDVEQRSVACFA